MQIVYHMVGDYVVNFFLHFELGLGYICSKS